MVTLYTKAENEQTKKKEDVVLNTIAVMTMDDLPMKQPQSPVFAVSHHLD